MKKAYIWFYCLFVFVLSAILTYFLFLSGSKEIKEEDVNRQVEKISLNVDEDSLTHFLLLGYGGEGHDGGYLSDVIMMASVDKKNKQITLVSIPRDLWVSIPIQSDKKQNFKINAAYAIGHDDRNYALKEPQYKGKFGGGNLTKKVIEDMLKIKISSFVAVDFKSFENIVDILGGIEVNVPKTFDDYFYPVKGLENETCGFSANEIGEFHAKYSGFELEKQFTCRYEHLHFNKGNTLMDGKSALKFVRSRHSNEYGGDFSRGERQNSVLFALKEKLISIHAVKNAESIYQEFKNLVVTDVDVNTYKTLSGVFGNPKDYNIKHIGLSTDNVLIQGRSSDGQFILTPKDNKWSLVKDYINHEIGSN